MRRIWHPYTEWEDYRAGLFTLPFEVTDVEKSRTLLANPEGLRDAMADVVLAWPIAAEQNLTDLGSNRRAWLGQAACMHAHGAPADATKLAWWQLAETQRYAANASADRVITWWEEETSGAQALFA